MYDTCDDCGGHLKTARTDKDFNFQVPWCRSCGLLGDYEGLKQMTTPQIISWYKQMFPNWRHSELRELSKLLDTVDNVTAIRTVQRHAQ